MVHKDLPTLVVRESFFLVTDKNYTDFLKIYRAELKYFIYCKRGK